LLRRLGKLAGEVLRFTVDPMIPFSNNDAGREVRIPKVKLKIINTFRTTEGARNFCILRSSFSPLKKQGQKLPDSLEYASQRKRDPAAALVLC
jgi:transposase